jgi:hypothetical protein
MQTIWSTKLDAKMGVKVAMILMLIQSGLFIAQVVRVSGAAHGAIIAVSFILTSASSVMFWRMIEQPLASHMDTDRVQSDTVAHLLSSRMSSKLLELRLQELETIGVDLKTKMRKPANTPNSRTQLDNCACGSQTVLASGRMAEPEEEIDLDTDDETLWIEFSDRCMTTEEIDEEVRLEEVMSAVGIEFEGGQLRRAPKRSSHQFDRSCILTLVVDRDAKDVNATMSPENHAKDLSPSSKAETDYRELEIDYVI